MNQQYAKIDEGAITDTGPRPRWLDTNSDPVSDAVLIANGRLPIMDDLPEHDPDTQRAVRRDREDWTIGTDSVTVTYDVIDRAPEDIAEERRAGVNAERARRILAGTTVTVTGIGDIPVTGTDDDTRNLQGLVTAAQLRLGQGDVTTLTPFRDAANVVHDLTPMQMVELWQQAAGYVSAVYQASWDIKALVPIPADYAADQYWPD